MMNTLHNLGFNLSSSRRTRPLGLESESSGGKATWPQISDPTARRASFSSGMTLADVLLLSSSSYRTTTCLQLNYFTRLVRHCTYPKLCRTFWTSLGWEWQLEVEMLWGESTRTPDLFLFFFLQFGPLLTMPQCWWLHWLPIHLWGFKLHIQITYYIVYSSHTHTHTHTHTQRSYAKRSLCLFDIFVWASAS